jgi:hypothetical protein
MDFFGKGKGGKGCGKNVWMPMFGMDGSGKGEGKGKAISAGNPLVDKIKAYQKQGEAEKQNWYTFAEQYGFNKDPARFEPDVLEQFATMIDLGALEVVPPSNGGWGKGKSKASSAGPSSVCHPLVDKVKAYQRLGETEKWNWWTFTAQYGETKDPASFEPSVLEQFVSSVDMSALEGGAPAKGGYGKGKGKGKGKANMLEQFAAMFMNSAWGGGNSACGWGQSAKGGCGKGLPEAISAGNPLVDKIKAYQRQGEVEKQSWWAFCEQHGPVKVPARLGSDVLEQFIALAGIE